MQSDIMVYVLYSKFIYSKCEKKDTKTKGRNSEDCKEQDRYKGHIVHIVLQHKNAGQKIVEKIILKKQHKSMDTFCRFDKIY